MFKECDKKFKDAMRRCEISQNALKAMVNITGERDEDASDATL